MSNKDFDQPYWTKFKPSQPPIELLGIKLDPELQEKWGEKNIILELDAMHYPGGFKNYYNSVSYKREQTVVINEVPGANGGVIQTTGTKTLTLTIKGVLRSPDQYDAIEAARFIENEILAQSKIVFIHTKLYKGWCLLRGAGFDLGAGQQEKIPVELDIVEYRQPSIMRDEKILEVNFGPYSRLAARLQQRNTI